jgi:hypothetical protein
VHDFGMEQHEVGKYLIFPPLFFDAGAVLFGHLASRARARGSVGVPRGLGVAAMVLLLVGAGMPFVSEPGAAMLMASVSMAGGGGLSTVMITDLMARVPPGSVSTAGGMCAAAQSLAYIVANPLMGLSVTVTQGYTQVILLLTAWVVLPCVGWILWRLPPPRGERVEEGG